MANQHHVQTIMLYLILINKYLFKLCCCFKMSRIFYKKNYCRFVDMLQDHVMLLKYVLADHINVHLMISVLIRN